MVKTNDQRQSTNQPPRSNPSCSSHHSTPPTTQFTKDQDFSSSLEGPSEAEVQAKEAAEREEALVEKIWEAPSEELKKERRDVREGGDGDAATTATTATTVATAAAAAKITSPTRPTNRHFLTTNPAPITTQHHPTDTAPPPPNSGTSQSPSG